MAWHQAQSQHLRDLYRDSTSRLSETKSRWAWASRSWSIATMWRCWLQWHTRPCSRLEDFSLRQMTTMMVRMKRASRTGVHIEDWLTKTWRCWRQFLWTNSCWQVTNAEISVGSCPGAWHTTTEPRIGYPQRGPGQAGRSDPFLTEQHECRRRLADLDRQHTVKSEQDNPDRGLMSGCDIQWYVL